MDLNAVATTTAPVIWLMIGLFVVIVGLFALGSPNDVEDLGLLLLPFALVVTVGAAVLALYVVGQVRTALWTWRIGSLFALVVIARLGLAGERTDKAERRLLAGMTIVAVALLGASFAARQPLVSASTVTAPSAVTAITIDGVRLWRSVALAMLGLGTIVFVWLFVRMVERGVPPQVESHWGGIGGGLGGWRVSASLTYLAAAAVFGVLFAIFVMQLEPRPAAPASTAAPPSSAPASGTPPTARPAGTPGT